MASGALRRLRPAVSSGAGGEIPVWLSWSGGKDCAFALDILRSPGSRWRVAALLTTISERYERVSMHGIRLSLLRAQADALGLPLVEVGLPSDSSNRSYESRMAEALGRAKEQGISHVAFGDLYLREVRAYREEMLRQVGFSALFPLWGRPRPQLAREFVDSGFRAVLTCVDTEQLAGDFVGREFDHALLEELPPHADPCGENGEFHTFVYQGPPFLRPIDFRRGERVLREERFMYCDLL